MEMEPQLLHGTIEATISEFQNIESLFARLSLEEFMEAECGNSQGQGHKILYATVYLDEVKMESKPITIKDLQNTNTWEMKFKFHCAQKASHVIFSIHFGKALNGQRNSILEAKVPVGDIVDNDGRYEYLVDLIDPHMNNDDVEDAEDEEDGEDANSDSDLLGCIQVNLKFTEAKLQVGIGSPGFEGVPETCFALRKGCKVTLYQDAHIPADFVDKMRKDGLVNYEPKRCWEDIFDAIKKAEKFVYIAGWSLYTEITLLRDPRRRAVQERQTTLGELLKRKAEDGVKVVLLLWDNQARNWPIPSAILEYFGSVNTHHNETRDYFENTRVSCVLSTRSTGYSHHQKFVLVDKELELPSGESKKRRRIVSFLGGFDLFDGRYDTPWHPLFRTLNVGGEHNKDFHQPSIKDAKIGEGGPREPWHDVHCQLEGPVALDVYETFVKRCEKEGKQDLLVPEADNKGLIHETSSEENHADDRSETWNVQLFRSIDDRAVSGLLETAYRDGDFKIDRSIQHAYIEAIRRAKNFIYIENQYFMGSCFDWPAGKLNPKKLSCLNLIPKELSLKIVSKIEARESFTVYVVIPMWPEGLPDSPLVQLMLDLQRRTIEMMYKDIIAALRRRRPGVSDKEILNEAQNYLAFFWLGNREKETHEHQAKPKSGSHYMKAQRAGRFMIYVHSKMMIVDDEYIIIGSANINERSMNGGRDTEIAMGAYQPSYLATNKNVESGQIHRFRLSLWYEHLGIYEETFLNPKLNVCIRRVHELAQNNWNNYRGQPFRACGHLLRYPIGIST